METLIQLNQKYTKFKSRRKNINNAERAGRPRETINQENKIDKIIIVLSKSSGNHPVQISTAR